ncbi:bifunctional alpha/beta hydrolase/OsmC family protein [Photobacterium sp. 1_MG-2023]|uniref:bifunctional alpha/beta hydrolase/OsmC family protein n=1 Tax=Photobacterium sp. 1_MG-2023 TaxID=3062646 RepID=UPI0026E24FEB|nr:bifunctional alpha/beta hydrolase/OsmC family protein [Photobacterium sp. 1_MG-2023]MDO6704943.1 bifunctional alpha/beta hydrolase/OsmC family protein [Photobacterium sp. 1_MG-2023]
MATKKSKLTFTSHGLELAALLEAPDHITRGYAIFAHCFTCGKDIVAAARITRSLTDAGFAVLRFDFTGLGGSEGDFANTNYSSNVEDLIAAASYLEDNYLAPSLLIGHSLGGRAVISAAQRIQSVQAVATIGAPADAAHVAKQFSASLDEIQSQGVAKVNLAGREFSIQKQFLDDIHQAAQDIESLRVPLLIFHSPLDKTVSIAQAEKIDKQAKHPKSFISLDHADHLLTNKADATFVAQNIAIWSTRYIKPIADATMIDNTASGLQKGDVRVTEKNHQFTRRIETDHHQWLADEPLTVNGDNLGPDPYEHLLAALGACTSMTLRMYAKRKNLNLDDVQILLSHTREHGEDCLECDETHPKIDVISRELILKGDLTFEERQRLTEIADLCPVHKTLENKVVVRTTLKPT